MTTKPVEDTMDKCLKAIESVKRHIHLIEKINPDGKESLLTLGLNNRIILSDNIHFLRAIQQDIGGEIILDSAIGAFLYYEESLN